MSGLRVLAKDNPFSTAHVERLRYRLSEAGWSELLGRLEKLNYHGSIVGPHGAGKTTLLQELGDRLEKRGFETIRIRLNTANRSIPKELLAPLQAGARAIVLLDGCEQLGPIGWRLFRWRMRCAAGLIGTQHLAGRLPTLFECQTSPQLLIDLVNQLQGSDRRVLPADAERLYHEHHGNIRDAFRALYDHVGAGF